MTTTIIILVTVLSANWFNAKKNEAEIAKRVAIEREKDAANKQEEKAK